MGGNEPFKICNKCGYEWNTVESFVLDANLRVEGYQAMFGEPEDGLYILTHECPSCMTSLSVKVESLSSLYKGKRDPDLKFLSPECEGHCFKQYDLSACNVECSMRWAREVLQYLRNHKLPDKIATVEKLSEKVQ